MASHRLIIWLFLTGFSAAAPAQPANIGLPPVQHYYKSAYRAGTQTWDIAQNKQGVMFFANNEGLLCFDGAAWKRYPIANGTCLRSICLAPEQRVYVGGQGEIGYFEPDERGCLLYHSLNGLIAPEARNFADVWDIVFFQGHYFFRTADRIFRFAQGKITTFSFSASLEYCSVVSDQLLIHHTVLGICRYDGVRFVPLAGARPPSVVTAMLVWTADTVLVATLKHGFFSLAGNQFAPWHTAADPFLQEKRIYTAARMTGDRIAVGTTLGGLVVLEPNRQPRLWLRKGAGLQNNNILSVCPDRAGNIWLGLDNGIDYAELGAPFYRILPDGDLEGAGYAARMSNGTLYLGTSNGLFYSPWKSYYDPFREKPFLPVRKTTGQVWGLNAVGGALLLGHHEGAMQVRGGEAELLSGRKGTWQFMPLGDSFLVAGQYDGLSLFARQGDHQWHWVNRLPGLDESCRIIVPENHHMCWISHPYRGVFRVLVGPRRDTLLVRRYGQAEGLPSDLFNYVFQIGGRPVVAAEKGVFRYDPGADRFVPAPEFDGYLGLSARTRYLREDGAGNIWFITGDEAGVLWVRDEGLGKKIRRQLFPQLAGQMVGGFEHIYPLDANNLFFGVEKGFLHLSPERLAAHDSLLEVIISAVSLPTARDSLIYGGFRSTAPKPALPFPFNSLHLVFAATTYGESRQIQYSSRLSGLEQEWSAWSAKTERDFAHLPPGNYQFMVKARDETGRESAAAVYEWRILPPWYASKWAYGIYALLALTLLLALALAQRLRFEREKAVLTLEHQKKEAHHRQRAEKSEQELVRVQNEKLEAEVQHKNEELALATMHLVQKGEMLASIQEALERVLQREHTASELRNELRRMLRLLQIDTRTDQDWEQFAVHFDQVYGDFLRRLREKFPQLSPNDYRLCAYLRMNLNTKEIAHLLNISVRGVEGSRYRLRRKLNLDNEENLVDFLMNA